MQNINFNDGYKEFTINNDEGRVIRFNPSDYGIIERFSSARKTIIEAVKVLQQDIELKNDGTALDELDEAAELITKVNCLINEQIDYIFNADVSKVAFGKQSPISTVKGKFLFDRFLDAVGPYIENEIKVEQEASQKRIQKYTGQVK